MNIENGKLLKVNEKDIQFLNREPTKFWNEVSSIGIGAFSGCSSLTNINIPKSITNIGDWAFYGCMNLTNINIPESVTSIGRHAFSVCKSLINITIPKSVTSIGNNAFSWMYKFKKYEYTRKCN